MELNSCNICKSTNNITLYHQNICSLINKVDEISIILQRYQFSPHFICLTEHHLKGTEISSISLEDYTLASSFCRKLSSGGGVCIFIKNNLKYKQLDLSQFCLEKTLEICAVKLYLGYIKCFLYIQSPYTNHGALVLTYGKSSKLLL